jgi:hypothetical protein
MIDDRKRYMSAASHYLRVPAIHLLGLLAALGLGSCTHQGVQDMGGGQHSLTAVSRSGGFSGSHEEAIEQANEWCAKSGLQAIIDGFYDHAAVAPDGAHRSSIIFACGPRTTPRQ